LSKFRVKRTRDKRGGGEEGMGLGMLPIASDMAAERDGRVVRRNWSIS